MDVLLEPFDYAFLRHALVACTIAGALCGLLGVYVTLRSMSYLGHGLSHAVFGGAAACAALGLNVFVGAGVWGVGSGLAVSRITRRRVIGGDAAIGVVTTASFASERPVAITVAPRCFAMCTAARPVDPEAPWISTVSPRCTRPRTTRQ